MAFNYFFSPFLFYSKNVTFIVRDQTVFHSRFFFPFFGRTTERKADELGLALFHYGESYSLRYFYREVFFKRLIHYGLQQLAIKRA